MQTITSQALFSEANQLLTAAEAELEKAEEDVVNHLICHNARQSMANYLSGYLLDHGGHLPFPASLEKLLEKCQALDARFQQIDLSPIHCRFDTNDREYCLDHKTVGGCLHIAKQVQALLSPLRKVGTEEKN